MSVTSYVHYHEGTPIVYDTACPACEAEKKPAVMPEELSAADIAELDKRFSYHPPITDQAVRYQDIRSAAWEFAALIMRDCPDSRERATSLTHLDAAVMFANAAIARNES
jgi:hypothetical protein